MIHDIKPLFDGFPGQTGRGFLGWSSAYLIQVKGDQTIKSFLYDTGGYNERKQLSQVLRKHSVKEKEIDGVILSHLHFDHAVNWTFFPQATIYIHKAELYPSDDQFNDIAVPEFHKEALLNNNRLQFVEENDVIEGMKVIHLPGHTEGLVGLQIGKRFLVSDAIKNRNEIHNGKLMNTWDEKIARQTILRIMNQAETIYPGHDIPLTKQQNEWIGTKDATETIYYAASLVDDTNQDNVTITIQPFQT
ncbi:MBL fold metallo-hydrolase [Lentibacillus sp. N15]|uniref:MBL fold metallo-hydrolase n=1 Tax=Lentibacillus songyuanensis TaxID=3136161 RepID=UPI0031BAFFD6